MRRYPRPGYVRITDEELGALPDGLGRMTRDLFVLTDKTMWLSTYAMR
jgi:hypothetical protein